MRKEMKKKIIISSIFIFSIINLVCYVVYAEFGIGLPSVIKKKVEALDKKVEEKKKGNTAPNVPGNPSPVNAATNQEPTVYLSWTGGDPDGDPVTYDVCFGTSSSPSLVSSNVGVSNYDPGNLAFNNTYYWQIVAKDNKGASTVGPKWSFTVRAGVWGTAALIETYNAGSATYPQIAVDTNGNGIAVWYQSDGMMYNIWARRYVAGTGWGIAALIETDNVGDALYPQIAVDTNGNGIAVWYQYDGTRWNIWANRYVAGTGWGTVELIETNNTGSALYPQIAVDTNGNGIAVWRQSDGTRYNIWANHYK
ncbi:MAG: hypothetical protein ABH873_05695 [Candidatus Firestonebacteria bacterium]